MKREEADGSAMDCGEGAPDAAAQRVLDEIRQRWAPLPKGPWGWFGIAPRKRNYPGSGPPSIYLATEGAGRKILMDFVRWGMQQGQPRFQDFKAGLMRPAEKLVEHEVDYRDEIARINDPTAIAFQHCKADVDFLLSHIECVEQRRAEEGRKIYGALEGISNQADRAAQMGTKRECNKVVILAGRLSEELRERGYGDRSGGAGEADPDDGGVPAEQAGATADA